MIQLLNLFVICEELQLQLNAMDKRLIQKNEEMNILLNYKVSVVNYEVLEVLSEVSKKD